MQTPPILFLNGTSSSGKTTVARTLQKLWREPLLYVSCDAFIFMLADHVLKDDAVRPKVLWPVLSPFNRSLAPIADCGLPLVIDYVLEADEWVYECVTSLVSHNVLFVGVKCPLGELERREKARGDRKIGLARWQLERVHRYGTYDFEIDTHAQSPDACAAQLRDLMVRAPLGRAFPRLRETMRRDPFPRRS